MLNLYNVLGVPESATKEQIKKAYREQIKFFHPDVFQGNPEVAKEKTIQLNTAYATLMDDTLRRTYDENLNKERQKERESRQKESESKRKEEKATQSESEPPDFEEEFLHLQMKKAKRWRIAAIVLAILAFYIYGTEENRIEKLEAERFEQITSLQNDVEKKEARIENLENEATKLRLEIFDLNKSQSELSFWKDSAVIVTVHGEKYHTYGCQYIEGRSFWIYNVEAAISRGYEPCSVCDPPRG